VVEGDEPTEAARLAAHVGRRPVRQGISAAPQQRHLALLYVLVPATRAVWDDADLGPVWAYGRSLARAVVAVREGRDLPTDTPALDEASLVQAHLPPPWVAELAVGAVAAGRDDGRQLLDQTWALTHRTVADMARRKDHRLRKVAKSVLGQLPVLPERRLELRLLGPIELHDDALVQDKDWQRERVRLLLAHLALHRTVSRGQIAADLWPQLDQDAQSHNLRVTLTYLLRVLEPQRGQRDASYFLRQHGSNISLHAGDRLNVDLWVFDAACDRANESDRQGAPGATLEHALRAVELWRGEPTELASEPWALAPVEQRRLRFAATAVRAGELLLAQGDTHQAQALAEQALTIDPWLDAAHRLVVAGHYTNGNDLAARQALHRYRDAIHELGLDPGEATLMVERLLDGLQPEPPSAATRPDGPSGGGERRLA
jgi:LuxR family maltose regulon positive regulatory protein